MRILPFRSFIKTIWRNPEAIRPMSFCIRIIRRKIWTKRIIEIQSLRGTLSGTCNIETAKIIGKIAAERALAKGITTVVFDRGGHMFHGKVKALADAAREAGLKF